MAQKVEIDRVCPSVVCWHRYAPEVKAELFSTAVVLAGEAFLIDPIAIDVNTLRAEIAPAAVSAVISTNENHGRAVAETAAAAGVPVYADSAARPELKLPSAIELRDPEKLAPALSIVPIEGAPAGEIAIFAEPDGGSLIIGDALINMESYGFTFLPAKYCVNHKRMRRALRQLLDLEFQRILFAHGVPIVTNAKRRLAELLESAA